MGDSKAIGDGGSTSTKIVTGEQSSLIFCFFPPILSNDVVAFSKLSSSFRYLTSEHRRLEIILDPYHKIKGV